MDQVHLTDLIDRVERLTAEDHYVDHEIECAISDGNMQPWSRARWEHYETERPDLINDTPRYTISVDDAMSLIPRGMDIVIQTRYAGQLGAHVFLFGPSAPAASDYRSWGESHIISEGDADPPLARALTAALLKARSAGYATTFRKEPSR